MTATFITLGWFHVASVLWLGFLIAAVYRYVYRETYFLYWALSFGVEGLTLVWVLAILPPGATHLITSPVPFLFAWPQVVLIALAAMECAGPKFTRKQSGAIFALGWLILLLMQGATQWAVSSPDALSETLRLERAALSGVVTAWFCVAFIRCPRMTGRAGAPTVAGFSVAFSVFGALLAANIAGLPVFGARYSVSAALLSALLPMGMAAGMILLALEQAADSANAVRRNEEQFRQLAENIRQVFWLEEISPVRLVYLSPAFEEIWGMSREEVYRDTTAFLRRVHPDDLARVTTAYNDFTERGFPGAVEFRIVRPDGSVRWILNRRFPVVGADGKIIRYVGIGEDVTDERNAQAVVRESEERFRRVFEDGPLGIAIMGVDRRIVRVNPALAAMLGYTQEEIRGRTFREFTHPDDIEPSRRLMEDLIEGKIPNYRTQKRYFRKDKKVVWVDLAVTQVRDTNGDILYGLGMTIDITDYKNAEARLQDLTDNLLRMQDDERRRIARDLHDSTGQNLAALKLNLARLAGGPRPAEFAHVVSDSVALADTMLAEIRTLSYLLHPPLLDELGLSSAVRAYVAGFSGRSGIEVNFDMPANCVRLGHDVELALFRIIQESLTNVHRHSGSERCWISVEFEDGHVSLEIRDEGGGMPPEVVERGLGVGLAGMHERARQLGGRLKVESGAGGSRIIVRLPVGANA